jgi:hypothetical protein
LFSAVLAVNMLAVLGLGGPASARSTYELCTRECTGDNQCLRQCGADLKQRRARSVKLPPTDIPKEPEKPVAKWIEDVFNPVNGGADGAGGSGR